MRQNCLKLLHVDNCQETCHQTVYFYLGQFWIWMLNISDFNAIAFIGITKEVYHFKTTQTYLKLSSLDNCQDLSGVRGCVQHHNIKENIPLQDQSERMWTTAKTHVPSETMLALKSFEDVWWIFISYAVLEISITKKMYYYKMGRNCLMPSHMKNGQDTYANGQYTDTCGKYDSGWWMLVTCIHSVLSISITKKMDHYKMTKTYLSLCMAEKPRHMCHQTVY